MSLLTRIAGGLVRFALAGVMGWLVHKGIIEEGQVDLIISGIALGLIAVVWSIANKYGVINWIQTALNLQPGTSPELLEHVVKKEKKDTGKLIALFLLLSISVPSACTKKPAVVVTGDDRLHTVATRIDQSAIALDQSLVVLPALASDGLINAEASDRLKSGVLRIVDLAERFRAGTAAVDDFNSGQTELREMYSALINETGSLAVNLGLSEEARERIVPLIQIAVDALEALKPLFGGGSRDAVRAASIPITTIASLAAVAATITAYERSRAGLTTNDILVRARDTLARAKTRD